MLNDIDKNINLVIKNPCIILGSSWSEEEKYTAEIINSIDNVNWIIVPHEIHDCFIHAVGRKKYQNQSISRKTCENSFFAIF